VSNLEADGPYPGRPDSENNLQNLPGNPGAQSTDLWDTTGRQTSWVQCADGKTALGGGFGDNDADDSMIRVVTSAPVQISNEQIAYEPIDGDAAGSFKPNGWLVEGYNEGETPITVRPWVVCAEVD
jgi:hypothetical protein